MTAETGYKDIGWANGWYEKPPDEYERHRDGNHQNDVESWDWGLYRTCHTYKCNQCRIIWHVDSGD